MRTRGDMWAQMGSSIASFMIWAMYFPHFLQNYIQIYCHKLLNFFHPYVQITFHEFSADRLKRNQAYTAN
ncbi:hypothetical protein ACSBR2_010454 [Camellia fascicularis]